MNEDRIIPAFTPSDHLPNEMSAEDFQRKLYAWFEDRGLLSELRAHLRTRMIGVLKDKGVGRIASSTKISPKLQALNLLIAEFLLHQDYHYSLSVFSAEVPLTNVLPEFPNGVKQTNWKFADKDMWDILETLGIQRYTEEAQNVFTVYYSSLNESLLTCVIKMLHALRNQDACVTRINTVWRKDVHEILTNNCINTQNANKILNVISEIIQGENIRLRAETHEDYLKLEHDLQLQVQTLTKSHEQKVNELQRSLNVELTKNDEISKTVERQKTQHRERLQKLIVREQNVSIRESQIKEKDAFIKAQEMLIQSKMDALQHDQRSLTVLQETVNLRLKEEEFRNSIEVTKHQNDGETQDLIVRLTNENSKLKALNAKQQLYIRELSTHAIRLARDLEDTQHTIRSLEPGGEHGIITAPPLASPVYLNQSIGGGGGEEGPLHARIFQRPPTFNTPELSRRRSTARKFSTHCSSSSDETSPTKKLLQDAREKLRRLEVESEEIDRNYRLYQSTLNSNFSALKVPDVNMAIPMFKASLFSLTTDNENINENKLPTRDVTDKSDVSSDAWDGAGTSGVSFSIAPSDDKSDSQDDED